MKAYLGIDPPGKTPIFLKKKKYIQKSRSPVGSRVRDALSLS